MRVLLTHERFAPEFAGGGEYTALEIARNLTAQGIEVRVLTTGDPRIDAYEGIRTVRLPIHRYRFNLAARHIERMARDVDLIHTFNYQACLPSLRAGRRAGKPVVCMTLGLFRDAWKAMRGPIMGRVWMAWEKFLLTRPYDKIVFPSDYSRAYGLEMGIDPDRTLVNPPGIDLAKYGPADPKDDVILFVGKLDVRKGIHEVLAAARDLPEARFRIMGWGTQEQAFRRQALPNVTFIPFERGQRLQAAFAHARIFLLPSQAETFGIALVEAMASGCAIISTVPLTYEGVRLPLGTKDEIVSAVRSLWPNRELTERMGRRNVALAQAYTWERHAKMLVSLYHDLVSGSPSPQLKPDCGGSGSHL